MRRILLSSLSVYSFLLVRSQTFTSEAGINYMLQPNGSHDLSSYGITYSPRLNFWEKGNSSLSMGLPLSFGWSDAKSPHFAVVDLPAEVDYNFGAGSARGNKKKFGFFIGAGYGFHVTVVHYYPPQSFLPIRLPTTLAFPVWDYYYGPAAHLNVPKSTFGPTLNAGFRLATGHKGKTIEFRFSYMKVLEVPDMLQKRYFYDSIFYLQNTIILGAGCFISL
jgi:hypothetical protein